MNQELYDYITDGNYDTSDVADLTATLQAEAVAVRKPVLVADLAQYADENGQAVKLIAADYNPNISIQGRVMLTWAQSLLKAKYDDFSMESPNFLTGLDGLVSEGIFDQEDKSNLLSLSYEVQPLWPDLTESQVRAALLWPQIEVAIEQRDNYAAQMNIYEAKLMLLYQGVDPDEEAL